MKLYHHPLSTYSQKVLIALYEKDASFEPEIVSLMDDKARADYKSIYPLGKIPLLVEGEEEFVPESSIIIEYLDTALPDTPRMIPTDPVAARKTRFYDRMYDQYLNESVVRLLFDTMKPEDQRDAAASAKANERIAVMYGYMQNRFADNQWCMGDEFTLAECSAAPALFYAQQVAPFTEHTHVMRYWERLVSRPSVARVFEEAAPHLAKMAGAG